MGKQRASLQPSLHNRLRTKTLIGFVAAVGLAALLLILFRQESLTGTYCTSCTIDITGTNSSTYVLNTGDVVCIAPGAVFSGSLQRNSSSGTGTVIICNEGTIQNATISLNKGINEIGNYGTMTGTSLQFNSGTSANTFTNHAGASATFGGVSFTVNNTTIDNHGSLSTGSFSLYRGTFTNHGGATMQTGSVDVGSNGSITNDGTWTASRITVNSNGTFTNTNDLTVSDAVEVNHTFVSTGTLSITTDLRINGSATATLDGTAIVGGRLEVNKNLIQSGTLTVQNAMQINGSGRVTVSGRIQVGGNIEINGWISGPDPATGTYGRVDVAGQSTLNGSGKLKSNLDFCDAGSPAAGVDNKYGASDATVTYCINNPPGFSLPVAWAGFDAQVRTGGIELTWATARELNNAFFTVERSADARTFDAVKQIDGVGNSDNLTRYTATDEHPPVGALYYRIRQTDFDGKTSFSPTVQVGWEAAAFGLNVYPNPLRDQATVEIQGDAEGSAILRVTDMQGRTVYQAPVGLRPGTVSVPLDASGWQAGTYVVEVRSQGGSRPAGTFRVVKQ
ncbi:MAG: hypothetical protein OHK0039_43290 [Bacteroidia bacterium]